jgi:hypothetical protein
MRYRAGPFGTVMNASLIVRRRVPSLYRGLVVFLAVTGFVACSQTASDSGDGPDSGDSADSGGSADNGDNGDNGDQGAAAAPGTGTGGLSNPAIGGSDFGSDDLDVNPPVPLGGAGNGEAEVCDGVDNDMDGNIDNVDAGGDGICDCLVIGTVGYIGPWSTGTSNVFLDWLNSRSPVPAVVLEGQELTPERIQGINVLVVLRADTQPIDYGGVESPAHAAFSDEEVATVEAWIKAGGGLMTTAGYQEDEGAEVVNVNKLLAPFNIGYSTTKVDLGTELEDWQPGHPVSNGISYIFADNGVVVEPGDGDVIARDADRQVAMAGEVAGQGHVLVYGDEWITYDSEWQDNKEVELLWVNMLKWLTPAKECQVPVPPELFE